MTQHSIHPFLQLLMVQTVPPLDDFERLLEIRNDIVDVFDPY